LPNATTTRAIAITSDAKVFMAAASNGQASFWRIATGERILSGAYIDDELVVYDANGYFMATYEGSQFVFLKFPSLPGYMPFKQFAKTLQRPDVIKAAFEGGPPPIAPSLTPPPRLRLAATPVAGSSVRLAISASAREPLDRLRLFVDGQLWQERTVQGLQIELHETIEVPAQSRWLSAVIVDASGSESVPVAEALPRDDRPSRRRLYALAVGTDTYRLMPADLQLRYAVSDARNFLAAVKSQNSGYYALVETGELFDAPGLRTQLPARLRVLAKAATANDTILLFAFGHGYRAPDGKLYLLVAESDQTRLEATSLSWDELAQALGETRARIIVFIDACHSGAVPNGGSNDEIADAFNARQVRFTVVAAAKGRQESFEREDFGGGVFTSAIVSDQRPTSHQHRY
jgi:Caspase domain